MMRWRATALGLLLALLGGTARAAETSSATIGLVFQKEFNGALGQLLATERQLTFSLPVHGTELVTTEAGSTTALEFLDRTRLQVGPNSRIVLDHYVYDPATGTGDAALRFSAGIFRFVTGDIKNKAGIQLSTPSASLSIRGTKVIIQVDADGNSTFYFEEGWGVVADLCGKQAEVHAGQAARVTPGCELSVVEGNPIPTDPSVTADLPVPPEIAALLNLLESLEPGAGPETPSQPVGGNDNSADPPGRANRASPS